MIKPSAIFLTGLSACAIFSGCIFQDKENSGKNVQANIELKASPPSAALGKASAAFGDSLIISDSSGLKFTVLSAQANVKKIKLEGAENKCGALPKISAIAEGNDSSETNEEGCGDEKEFEV